MKYPRLPKKKDKRVKISKRRHAYLKKLYFKKAWSIAEIRHWLARPPKKSRRKSVLVSETALYYIFYPKKKKRTPWKMRYNRKRHRVYMSRFRRHKLEVQPKAMRKYEKARWKKRQSHHVPISKKKPYAM